METLFIEKGKEKMNEQLDFFYGKESYNLSNLKKLCRDEIKKQYPNSIDGEDYVSYLEFINDETDLLFAQRIREMADEIENRIYGKQKKEIQEVYGYVAIKNKGRK